MTDVFISYSREDREVARLLAESLERKGISVWWDWNLIGGTNYRSEIRSAIAQAGKVIVLWSRNSVMSGFVIDEATEAKKLGKLVPVAIDDADLPFGFGDLHTITLSRPALDVEPIVAALQGRSAALPPRRAGKRWFDWRIAACLAFVALLATGGAAYWYVSAPKPSVAPPPPPVVDANAAAAAKSRPAATTPRIALVIGNSAYRNLPVLPNAGRDAERISEALKRVDFRVIKKMDLGRTDMISAIAEFESTLAIVGGVGVFYYSGSAVYVDGDDIMLPVDTMLSRDRSLLLNGINLTQLQSEVRSRITQTMTNNGIATIYSASKGQYAADGPPGQNSPFTSAFLKSLTNSDDELGDLFRNIGQDLETAQRNDPTLIKQTPYFENTLRDKFYFSRPEQDAKTGVSKILIIDSCRDNPFKINVAK